MFQIKEVQKNHQRINQLKKGGKIDFYNFNFTWVNGCQLSNSQPIFFLKMRWSEFNE